MSDATSKKRILCVEDDIFMIELLVRELIKAGFEALVAKTGQEALDQFNKERLALNLILLDLLLPDIHGFEVLRTIRRDPQGREIKVVVLSNLSDDKDKEEAKRLGVVEYLVKANNSLPEIIERVKSVVGA